MTEKDWFHILHLPANASSEDVRKAYKRLVRQWHPDQFARFPERESAAQEKLKEINIAYRKAVSFLNSRPTAPVKVSPQPEKVSAVSRLLQKLSALFSFQPAGAARKAPPVGRGASTKPGLKFEDTLKMAMASHRPLPGKRGASRHPVRTTKCSPRPVAKRGDRIEKIRPIRPVTGI